MMNVFPKLPWLAIACILPVLAAPAQELPRVASLPAGATVPDAEVDEKGGIHVAYLSSGDVWYVSSKDEGRTFSEPIRVNTEAGFASGGRFRGPDLAIGKEGRVHVVWYNAGYQKKRPHDEWGVMYSRLEKKAERFEKARNLNQRPSDNFSVAANAKGNVAVIWMAGGVFASLSNDGGKNFAPPEDLKVDPCECCGSRAIYEQDGALAVLYRDKTDNIRDTNIARLEVEKEKWSNRVISETAWPITACPMTGSFLSHSKSGIAAGWETDGQIYFRPSLDDKGKEVRASKKGRYPVVLTTAEGTSLVAWKNDNQLEWQIFDSSNALVGKRGSHVSENSDRPAGVVTKSGKFVLFP
ncbi:MAG: hypothetical protein ACI9R3_002363 [Verrucomicrobiales bacterium]|jgi:hypothetical protein